MFPSRCASSRILVSGQLTRELLEPVHGSAAWCRPRPFGIAENLLGTLTGNSCSACHPIARKRVADFQQCKSACWNELRCVAFSFLKGVKGAQNCDLFNLAGAYQPDVSADSGFKFQPPDSL